MILVDIRVKLICAKDFGNLDQLVIVVMPVEERFLAEDLDDARKYLMYDEDREFPHHRSEHAAITPQIKTVIIFLEIHQEFRTFEVP